MFHQNLKGRGRLQKKGVKQPDSGWGSADTGGAGITTLVALAFVAAGLWGLWSLFDGGSESANLQDIATKTKGYMGGRNGYDYSSATTMTGIFIQRGLAPNGVKIVGEAKSGSATMWNTWGGQILLSPVSSGAGVNTGFSVTYNKVPQNDCISFAKQYGTGFFSEVSINSSAHSDGQVSAEQGGKECTQDSGSNGTNTLVFTRNG